MAAHDAQALDQAKVSLARFVGDLHRLRDLVTALKVASFAQDRAPGEGFSQLYWPSLMESVLSLLPDGERLEDSLADALEALREISADAAHRGAADGSSAAGEKRTKREALAAGARPA